MTSPRGPILRYHVPTELRDEHLDECIGICRKCGFEEVLLFSVDYLHQFYFDNEELAVHMQHLSYCADHIRKAGLVFSLNVMHTLGHLRVPEQIVKSFGFERQVRTDGRHAVHPVLDPLCPRLRDHMAAVYARYASLEPRLLFVDDDFRVDLEGAFHPDRVVEAASILGCSPTREAVAALLRDQDSVAKRVVRDLITRDLEDFATILESATHEISPATRLGLMFADGVEFDVGRAVCALAGPLPPCARPQVPLYREDRAVADYPSAFWAISKWRSILGHEVELYPECENYTYNDYAKSGPAAVAHLAASFARGESSPAVSLGSFATVVPAGESRRMIDAVSRRCGQLDRLSRILEHGATPAGIPLMTSGRPNLELLGLPFDTACGEGKGPRPVLVFGHVRPPVSPEMDSGFVLDVDSLRSLRASDLLDEIGVRASAPCDLYQVSDVAFDRGDRPGLTERFGLYYFLRNLDETDRPLAVEPNGAGDWRVKAWITDVSGKRLTPFAATWRTSTGTPFAFVNIAHHSWPSHAWLHPWFARLLASLVSWVSGVEPFAVVQDRAGVALQLCRPAQSDVVLLTLSNFSTAEYENVTLSLSPEAADHRYEEIAIDGTSRSLGPPARRSDGRFSLVVPDRLPCLDVRFLLAR